MKVKRLPWRTVFYLLVTTWLLLDLKYCNGPLKRKIAETRPSSSATLERARKNGWVALVNQEPVTKNQLDLAVARHLYQRGKQLEDFSDKAQSEIKRASLRSLIDDILIRQYADGDKFQAPEEEKQAFIESWEKQFHVPSDLEERLEAQNLSQTAAASELGKIWSQKRWLEQRISPGIGISDAEIEAWFQKNRGNQNFIEPEKIRARHIFISTVEEDSEAKAELIRKARERIVAGEDFAAVAAELSEDERTKGHGGDLNWFSRSRLPETFAKTVFAQKVKELGEPFKTEIGWHLVEVTDHQEARESTYDELKEEIRAHLLNKQKVDVVNELLGKLRLVANILVFAENL